MDAYNLAAGPLAEHWARWMLSMSLQVALLAAAVWAVTRLMRKSCASLRYALWLLVFVKLVLPPSLSAPWSAASLLDRVVTLEPLREVPAETWTGINAEAGADMQGGTATAQPAARQVRASMPVVAMSVWLLGSAALFGALMYQARRYQRGIASGLSPAPPELAALGQEIAARLGIKRAFRLCLSGQLSIPAVTGFRRPTVILPESLADGMSQAELSDVIGHELAHVKRHDIPVGWLTTLLLSIYWFHPVVWLAHLNLRREREMASDDAVLYSTRQEGRSYASTIVRMAEKFDDTAPAGAGFLGILEIADNLLHRVRSAADATRPRYMGRAATVAVALVAAVLLPMAVWTPDTLAADARAAGLPKGTPVIVSTEPASGATDVDPSLNAIRVTFSRNMAPSYSWTGDPAYLPEMPAQPTWLDARTCQVPVKLEPGKLYRVGINSASYTNFRSKAGVPVLPHVIAFVTKGADSSLAEAVQAPKVVSLNPERKATEVDPATNRLVVTFDREMGAGFSWTGGGEHFPQIAGEPTWSEDRKTCTLPVTLKPNWTYRLSLNNPRYNNFQSAHRIPLEPVEWTFKTGK